MASISCPPLTKGYNTETTAESQKLLTEPSSWFVQGARLRCWKVYLAIRPDGASTVCQELRHVIVADKLPQTGFQIQVSVES